MKIFAFLLTAVLCLSPFLDAVAALDSDQLKDFSARATVKNFPQADKVLLYDAEKHTYQPDGFGTVTDECYEKILTDKGRDDLRSLSIQYSTHYRKVEIPLIEVIRPDGTIRKIDVAANSREAVSTGSMGENIYDPAGKILTVNIPDLAVGDILHYIIRQQDIRVRVPKHWSDIFLLQYDSPILHYEVSVDAPNSLPLRAVAVKDEVKGTLVSSRKESGGRIIYTWTAKNVPQVIPEPHMPPLYTCVQRVLVSTSPDWQEISRWYWNLCLPHLETTPEIRKKTAELIAGKKDFDEKLMALFQFVSQQIRYMGINAETEAPGLEPHDIALTFNNRYGVCRDKAVLLVAMLREAGIRAFPALFMAGEPKDTEVANSFFNHAIVAVEKDKGNYILMDPTDESTADLLPAYLANMSYLPAHPEGETLLRSPLIPVEKNMLDIRTKAAVSPNNELSADTVFSFGGVNDQLYRDAFSRWNPEEREQFFNRILRRSMPGAELTSGRILPQNVRDMSEPLRVILKYRLHKALNPGAAEFLLPLCEFSSTVGAAALFIERQMGLTMRKFPMRFFSTCGVNEKLELQLPEQYKSVYIPGKQQLEVPGLLDFSREFRKDGKNFVMERSFLFRGVDVSPADYLKLKEAFKRIAATRGLPVFQLHYPEKMTLKDALKLFPQAQAVCLDESSQIELTDVDSWKGILRKKILVLNYSGMKSCSEMQIPYNPAWEKISVTATVYLPDGSSRKLSDKEINIMDAPWVSLAPRYPAEKILVISFPGVMPGAVIDCTVSTENRGKTFFSLIETFSGDMPVIRKRLSVTAPEKLKLGYTGKVPGVEFYKTAADGNGKINLTWEGRSLAALPQEINQPPAWIFTPTVFISAGERNKFCKDLRSALEKAVSAGDPRKVQAALAGMDAAVTASGKKERDLQKIRYIRDTFSKAIMEAGPALNDLPFSAISPASETLRSGYGNSADRAVLLATALNYAKIPYRFVAATEVPAFSREQKKVVEIPMGIFSAVLIYLPQYGIYLNDTGRFAPLGTVAHAERFGLELTNGNPVIIRPNSDGAPKEVWKYQLKLNPDGGVSMQATHRVYGSCAARIREFYTHTLPEKQKLYFQQVAARIRQGAEIVRKPIVKLDDPNSVTVQYELNIPQYAEIGGGYIQFAIPHLKLLAEYVRCGKARRETPAYHSDAMRTELYCSIQLPPEVKVVNPRPPRSEYKISTLGRYWERFEVSNNELRMRFALDIPVEKIEPQDYDRLVQLERKLLDPANNHIILKQEKRK